MIDLSDLATEYDEAILEADRALRIATIRLATARARKEGMIRTVEEMNRQVRPLDEPARVAPPVMGNGVEQKEGAVSGL